MDSDLRALSDRACIVGVVRAIIRRQADAASRRWRCSARAAIADAGLKPGDIDAILPYVLGRRPMKWRPQLGLPIPLFLDHQDGRRDLRRLPRDRRAADHNKIARNVLVFALATAAPVPASRAASHLPGELPPRLREPYGYSVPAVVRHDRATPI